MEFQRTAAILPVKDVAAAAARYARLGFTPHLFDADGLPIYAILKRDRIDLHLELAARDGDRPRTTSAVYFYVDDPDALYREWSAVAHDGGLDEPEDKAWGVREMTYVDPDGNLLRIGRILD